MRQTAAARTTTRRILGPTTVGLIVVTAAIIGTLFYQSGSSSAFSSSEPHSRSTHGAVPQPASSSAPSFWEVLGDDDDAPAAADGAVTEEDGVLPTGVTVFDDEYPGVANLDPDLLQALRDAATDAADHGIELYVNSGWRSPEHQEQLLREAVSEYGSEEEAARWVATANTSAHVSGDAVDIGPFDATAWLSEHGAHYGLCQIYRNESWHYERRPEAASRGCPPMYTDSTDDPRTRR